MEYRKRTVGNSGGYKKYMKRRVKDLRDKNLTTFCKEKEVRSFNGPEVAFRVRKPQSTIIRSCCGTTFRLIARGTHSIKKLDSSLFSAI
ncbi:hypothetical protein TNCV_1001511 [Trichonephila clavipes]|nr:hypothetical protein TNCV_1001511 [Trichonephila clavipes]